jgi:5-methylcytosine-specific restriction protein B
LLKIDFFNDFFKKFKSKKERYDLFQNAPKFVLIVDEINRGDISKILGELITLLEDDKRLGESDELIVQLPYSNEKFGVPPNIYIIGTMNTADSSISHIDVALRRRFGFVEMMPNLNLFRENQKISPLKEITYNKLDNENLKDLFKKSCEAIEKINEEICKRREIGREKQIGHSFLFKVDSQEKLEIVWEYEILPLVQEYSYGDFEVVRELLGIKNEYISEYQYEMKKIKENFSGFLKSIIGKNEQ